MKYIGIILITIGIAVLLFVGYNFLQQSNQIISPIPEPNGVRVIYVTPTK